MTTEDNVYTWICLRYDSVGLVTAELRWDNETVETLGGSHSKWTPVKFHAQSKWGNSLPIHWHGYEIPEAVKIDGVIEISED